MSRSRRLFAAYGLTLINQGLVAVVGLFVTRYVLHRIGESDYGLWFLGAQFLSYLVLLDLGVTALLPREVGTLTGLPTDDAIREASIRDLVGRSVTLVLLLVPPLLLASVVILVALPTAWTALRWPLAVSLLAFVVTYPFRVIHGLLTGLQDLSFLGWLTIGTWVLNVGATIALVYFHFGLYAVALGPAVGLVSSCAGWMLRAVTKYPHYLPRRFYRLDRAAIRAHLSPGLWVSGSQIGVMLLNSSDVMVIGKVMGPASVNPYAFTDKLQTFFNNQPYQIAALSGPALSEVKASGDKLRIVRAVGALTVVVLIVSGGIASGILVGNHTFVRVWIGEEHFAGMGLTTALLANMLMRHWAFMYLSALFYFGHERACTIITLADGALTLGLSVLFVHWFGLVGAALGPLVSVMFTQFPGALWLVGRDMGQSPASLFSAQVPWFMRFVPIAALAWGMGYFYGTSSVLVTVGLGAAVCALYAVVMLPLMLRPPIDVYAEPLLKRLGVSKLLGRLGLQKRAPDGSV